MTTAACNGGPNEDKRRAKMANASKPGVVNIKGREYTTVALRVQNFRAEHPDWSIVTEILHADEQVVRMKATISSGMPASTSQYGHTEARINVIATGHAEEYRNRTEINKTSAVENCETSAIGRALAAAGYGGTEFATADELVNALTNKPPVPGMSAMDVNRDEFNKMAPNEQRFIMDQATVVQDAFKEGKNLYDLIEGMRLQNEEKMALASQLPSDVRSAWKRHKLDSATSDPAVRRAFAPDLASQA